MTTEAASYRWNTSDAAEAYDAAAPVIHPCYVEVQDAILEQLPYGHEDAFELVDIGAGSGRLAERVLEQFAGARVTLVDQSAPFLALAERKLARFAPRAAFMESRLQGNWAAELNAAPNAIVSTSAIHHLESAEKRALYRVCFETLAPGGMFINGDEFRPADDGAFLALLEEWSAHMRSAIANGDIPGSFATTFDAWHDRNIRRFGDPKKSGDDCLETLEVQQGYLRDAGFATTEPAWAKKLWAVLIAQKT